MFYTVLLSHKSCMYVFSILLVTGISMYNVECPELGAKKLGEPRLKMGRTPPAFPHGMFILDFSPLT